MPKNPADDMRLRAVMAASRSRRNAAPPKTRAAASALSDAKARCRAAHAAASQTPLWPIAQRLYSETIEAASAAPSDDVRVAMFGRLAVALEVLVDQRGWRHGIVRGFAPPKIMAAR